MALTESRHVDAAQVGAVEPAGALASPCDAVRRAALLEEQGLQASFAQTVGHDDARGTGADDDGIPLARCPVLVLGRSWHGAGSCEGSEESQG